MRSRRPRILVPQNGTTQKLDTLGDKIMTPLVYQNRSGVESLWASQTVILNYPAGPTAVRWYQFDVTGGNFPATPLQQQSWTNGNDGLWRWMPSIAADQNGNMAIGYSTSSATQEPSIRYAGRMPTDPLNDLGQGEAVMIAGGGHQTHSSGRWGDYSMLSIDPTDSVSFWHVGEYYPATASASWFTRIGKFQFPAAPTPTPTATATATATFTPTPTATFTPTATATATATPTSTATPTPTPTPTPIPGIVRVTATAGNMGPVDYPSVKAAFDAINAGTHQGAIDVAILSDTTEVAPAVLNASGAPSSYTSVLVHPSGGAARTVSGAIVAGSPLIDLNGADNVTIDGLSSGGNSLTISNTTASATASTSTIRLINGAQNNTITRCTVLGSSTASTTIAGGNILISTSTGGANSNNAISSNAIGPAGANLPTKGVMSLGSASPNHNTGNLIDNNNVFDFFNAATSVAGYRSPEQHRHYDGLQQQNLPDRAARFHESALTYSGILVSTSGFNHTITGNTVGFGAANGTGITAISGSTNLFVGLDFTHWQHGTAVTSVQGNTISGISPRHGKHRHRQRISLPWYIPGGGPVRRRNHYWQPDRESRWVINNHIHRKLYRGVRRDLRLYLQLESDFE